MRDSSLYSTFFFRKWDCSFPRWNGSAGSALTVSPAMPVSLPIDVAEKYFGDRVGWLGITLDSSTLWNSGEPGTGPGRRHRATIGPPVSVQRCGFPDSTQAGTNPTSDTDPGNEKGEAGSAAISQAKGAKLRKGRSSSLPGRPSCVGEAGCDVLSNLEGFRHPAAATQEGPVTPKDATGRE
jgi:hypothetical protein